MPGGQRKRIQGRQIKRLQNTTNQRTGKKERLAVFLLRWNMRRGGRRQDEAFRTILMIYYFPLKVVAPWPEAEFKKKIRKKRNKFFFLKHFLKLLQQLCKNMHQNFVSGGVQVKMLQKKQQLCFNFFSFVSRKVWVHLPTCIFWKRWSTIWT